jgi:hypothetical protein
MALVNSQQGQVRQLTNYFADAMTLRLYTNNYTPVQGSTEGNFTEASGNGYSAKALTGGSWTITPGNPSSAAYAQQTYTFTGALGNVYGYFITRDADSKYQFGERFTDGPYNIVNNGDQIKITPNFTQT